MRILRLGLAADATATTGASVLASTTFFSFLKSLESTGCDADW
jgi:hypothetical protein